MTEQFNSQYLNRIYQQVLELTDEQIANRETLATFVVDKVNRSYGNGRRHGKQEALGQLQKQ